jgi:hypothetical protein
MWLIMLPYICEGVVCVKFRFTRKTKIPIDQNVNGDLLLEEKKSMNFNFTSNWEISKRWPELVTFDQLTSIGIKS